MSRSGKIRRLVAEAKDAKLARLNLHGTPGGAPAFELAAKFCYGVHVDVTVANVAMLRCATHYLQITDDFSDKSLELRAEAFLHDAVLPSIASSVAVLHSCEALLPVAEDVGLVLASSPPSLATCARSRSRRGCPSWTSARRS